MEEAVLEDASKCVDQSSFLLDELVWSREKHASGAKPFTRELQRAVVAMAVSWSYSEIACPSGVPGEVLEEVARGVSWSFLELPGLGEGQMLVEHPDGESEIEYLASGESRVGAWCRGGACGKPAPTHRPCQSQGGGAHACVC